MKNELIEVLEKNNPDSYQDEKQKDKNTMASSGCCGGTPVSNEDACCKLDEEKKAEGESGCGCETTDKPKSKTSCC